MYDYGFRIYNPRIGKFLSVDPLTNSYPWYTPFQFAGNQPIWAIDLDGLEELIVIRFFDQGKYVGHCTFRIEYAHLRDAGHRGGEDMQIIELDISQQASFMRTIRQVTYSDITDYEKLWMYLRNPVILPDGTVDYSRGTFKGEYRSTMAQGYSALNKHLIVGQKITERQDPGRSSVARVTQDEPTHIIQYPYDKPTPIEVSNKTLENIKTSLTKNPDLRINIYGYTSSENSTGVENYNITLSQNRANFVKQFLIDNGIDEDRILNCEGRGAENPVATNETEEGRAQNRRVEIDFTYEKTQ